MAVDMYLKLDDVKGEAKGSGHKEEIDILSWSWIAAQQGTGSTGGGSGSGKIESLDIEVKKWVDRASPVLYKYCCKGTHLNEALITVRKAGDTPLEYMKVTLRGIIITGFTTGAVVPGDDRLQETVRLNFKKVFVAYSPQVKGGAGDAETGGGFNLENGLEWDGKSDD
jgi:type VI secretion system secreted protein Hcp